MTSPSRSRRFATRAASSPGAAIMAVVAGGREARRDGRFDTFIQLLQLALFAQHPRPLGRLLAPLGPPLGPLPGVLLGRPLPERPTADIPLGHPAADARRSVVVATPAAAFPAHTSPSSRSYPAATGARADL